MSRIFIFILLFFIFSCRSNIETQKVITKSTGQTFNSIFRQVDSFGISSELVKAPINISILNDKMVICDYEKDIVDIFDNKGKLLFTITNQLSEGEKLQKPICTYCKGDSIFVASNHGRRILTYAITNNSIPKLIHSFIISQSNITPIDITGFGNKMIMAGFNMQTDKLLHLYTDEGKFLKSFMTCSKSADDQKDNYTQSALNYPFADYMNGNIYAIEHAVYRISKFDTTGNEIIKKEIRPDYYVPPDPDSINQTKNNYLKISNRYSWPIQLKAFDNYVFTQMEMPGPIIFNNPQDYFSQSNFRMDVFDKNCNPIYTGIDCGNKRLEAVDKKAGIFYFIAGYSSQKKSYIIETFSLKKPPSV